MRTKLRSRDRAAEQGLVAVDRPAAPFKRVLVPLDGSSLAERALPFARALARLVHGDLILTRAVSPGATGRDPLAAELHDVSDAEEYLERLGGGYQVDMTIEHSAARGEPASEIAQVARSRGADLVVMATHGRSGVSRLLLGSVASSLLRQLSLPMLLVRAGLELPRWEKGLQRILVPLDGSDFARTNLSKVAELAKAANARVVLLHVIPPTPPELTVYQMVSLPEAEDEQAISDRALASLSEAATPLNRLGVALETEVVFGPPAKCIAAAASEHACDLIAMTTHARTGLNRLVLGSVADEVLRAADVPLLVLREK